MDDNENYIKETGGLPVLMTLRKKIRTPGCDTSFSRQLLLQLRYNYPEKSFLATINVTTTVTNYRFHIYNKIKWRYLRFQTFAVTWIFYMFFWVFPRRQIVVGRRFGTLCQFHLQRLDVDSGVWRKPRKFIPVSGFRTGADRTSGRT